MTRFGIRPQAVLLAGVPLVALLLLLALVGLIIKHTDEAGRVADLTSQADQIFDSLSKANRLVQHYAITKRAADAAPFVRERAIVVNSAASLRQATRSNPALEKAAGAYLDTVAAGVGILDAFVAALRAGDAATQSRIINSPATRQVNLDFERTRAEFDQLVRNGIYGTPAGRRAYLRRLERLLLFVAIAGIAGTVAVSLLFGMRLVGRLRKLGENAHRLADGVPAVSVGGNDEITELDHLYRVMAERMQSSSRAYREAEERFERERNTATLLQQTLLPEIAGIRGLRIDTAYATPAEGAQIGGDWFDVFALSDRLVGLSVGDVTGHGLRAVAAMGFVRQAIRVVARLNVNPAIVMERVNRVVCEEQGSIASAFFGIYDRATGTIVYSLAGHGPPLVVEPGGESSLLHGEGMLLGLDPEVVFTKYERRLLPGDALVLYTDGVVEVERDYLKGMRDLEDAVRCELKEKPLNIAEAVQRRIFAERPPRDDAALLLLEIAEFIDAANELRTVWHFDARNQRVAWRVKRELLAALESLGANRPDPTVAELVYGELISNVVRHTPGTARVSFEVREGHVLLVVEDRAPPFVRGGEGTGHGGSPDEDAESGRGLFIVGSLCERIVMEPVPGGKRSSVQLPLALADRSMARSAAG